MAKMTLYTGFFFLSVLPWEKVAVYYSVSYLEQNQSLGHFQVYLGSRKLLWLCQLPAVRNLEFVVSAWDPHAFTASVILPTEPFLGADSSLGALFPGLMLVEWGPRLYSYMASIASQLWTEGYKPNSSVVYSMYPCQLGTWSWAQTAPLAGPAALPSILCAAVLVAVCGLTIWKERSV